MKIAEKQLQLLLITAIDSTKYDFVNDPVFTLPLKTRRELVDGILNQQDESIFDVIGSNNGMNGDQKQRAGTLGA
jgi:hypothetical protein